MTEPSSRLLKEIQETAAVFDRTVAKRMANIKIPDVSVVPDLISSADLPELKRTEVVSIEPPEARHAREARAAAVRAEEQRAEFIAAVEAVQRTTERLGVIVLEQAREQNRGQRLSLWVTSAIAVASTLIGAVASRLIGG